MKSVKQDCSCLIKKEQEENARRHMMAWNVTNLERIETGDEVPKSIMGRMQDIAEVETGDIKRQRPSRHDTRCPKRTYQHSSLESEMSKLVGGRDAHGK